LVAGLDDVHRMVGRIGQRGPDVEAGILSFEDDYAGRSSIEVDRQVVIDVDVAVSIACGQQTHFERIAHPGSTTHADTAGEAATGGIGGEIDVLPRSACTGDTDALVAGGGHRTVGRGLQEQQRRPVRSLGPQLPEQIAGELCITRARSAVGGVGAGGVRRTHAPTGTPRTRRMTRWLPHRAYRRQTRRFLIASHGRPNVFADSDRAAIAATARIAGSLARSVPGPWRGGSTGAQALTLLWRRHPPDSSGPLPS
jgi:hypothetical protein